MSDTCIVCSKPLLTSSFIHFDCSHRMHLSCGVQRIQQFKTRCVKCESDKNRASVPMMLLSRVLRNYGIRFVLSGEGADELFAGYSYNFYFVFTINVSFSIFSNF